MWSLYQTAKLWKTRPSQILGIDSIYVAYDLDSAVGAFGTFIEGQLDGIQLSPNEQKASNSGDITQRKRTRLMRQIMDDGIVFPELLGESDKQMNTKSLRAFLGLANDSLSGHRSGNLASV